MIINLWSTPRTGSVWYSNYLKSLYSNSVLLTEFFNQYHMNIYHTMQNGKRMNTHTYSLGVWYDDYVMINGTISSKKIFSERIRTVFEEETYRIDLFDQVDQTTQLILHNHVEPINQVIRQRLLDIAEKNIFIYRKDKQAQLASYAIAFATKQFVQFSNQEEIGIVDNIDPIHLINLIKRIKVWDQMPKEHIVAYEDIEFFNKDSWPKKQTRDYRLRLSKNMIVLIEQLVKEYQH